jgi:hypothetical protein
MMTYEGIKAREDIIDRLIKKEEVTDTELFLSFWELSEPEAREYCQERWFAGRRVTQNHITRKLRKWFPQVEAAKDRQRREIKQDPSHPKAYRCQNWAATYGYTLGWVSAGSEAEAKRLFELFLPVTENEFDKGAQVAGVRYIDLPEIVPSSEVEGRVVAGNAEVMASLLRQSQERNREVERVVHKLKASLEQIDGRIAAVQMFMSSTGSLRSEDSEESQPSTGEEVNP